LADSTSWLLVRTGGGIGSMPALAAVTGPAQLAECLLQRLDFPFVIDFLPLGQFQRFEHFLHFA